MRTPNGSRFHTIALFDVNTPVRWKQPQHPAVASTHRNHSTTCTHFTPKTGTDKAALQASKTAPNRHTHTAVTAAKHCLSLRTFLQTTNTQRPKIHIQTLGKHTHRKHAKRERERTKSGNVQPTTCTDQKVDRFRKWLINFQSIRR